MPIGIDVPADSRVNRIRMLARKLEENTALNTERSRARCRELALDILELLEEEDQEWLAESETMPPHDDGEVEHVRAAVDDCSDAREQSELTRLFTSSERTH